MLTILEVCHIIFQRSQDDKELSLNLLTKLNILQIMREVLNNFVINKKMIQLAEIGL